MKQVADRASIVLRELHSVTDVLRVGPVEREVWGLDDRDMVPPSLFIASIEVGGILIGAFDSNDLVGFVYGFVGLENGKTVIHSHMLAVRPQYRDLELGYRLKVAQREHALAQGVERITWTFDPLQSVNAHFNIEKLGATASVYKTNFYGEEMSSFLHRNGTDRLWVEWDLRSPRVEQRQQSSAAAVRNAHRGTTLVAADDHGAPVYNDEASLGENAQLIEIPGNINEVLRADPERALAWRVVTRRAFTEAFAAGYHVSSFDRAARHGEPIGIYGLTRHED